MYAGTFGGREFIDITETYRSSIFGLHSAVDGSGSAMRNDVMNGEPREFSSVVAANQLGQVSFSLNRLFADEIPMDVV